MYDSITGISCYCATYGRPKYIIENSIQCFLEQDYTGPKELVIFNDCKYQKFVYDHPEIKIINIDNKISTLGEKFNETIKLCQYDFLATWEDDDTFLKNRLSYSIQNMYNGLIFHTHDGFVERHPKKLIRKNNYFHSTHLINKNLYEDVGGYDCIDTRCVDIKFMKKLCNKIGSYSHKTENNKIFYIYNFIQNIYHASSSEFLNKSISKSVEERTIIDIQSEKIESGTINLSPKLRYNFYQFLPES